MIRFRLELADLAATSFAYSPLQETVLSLRLWTGHATRLPHVRVLAAGMRPAFEQLPDRELLTSLVARSRYWVPDLLTPRPPSPRTRHPGGVRRPARHRPGPPSTRPGADLPPAGRAAPAPARRRTAGPGPLLADIADALEAYWNACLLPRWPRIRSALESDLAHRARTLAEHGAGHLFSGISERLTWGDGVLSIQRSGPWPDDATDIPIDGRRLLLTPSCFVDGVSTMLGPDAPPHIVYTTRGLAVLGESAAPPVPRTLELLLGRPRAQLLALLAEPASTTELAHRLNVSPPAVSQHLSVLAAAGLLERTRHGRHVHYRQSSLGAALHTTSCRSGRPSTQ
ncbi:ArsR/SmtB family transcription factor [Kitasatospora sp. NPDC057223]|uniref:ArsR/SmtB family transcription factor n=1 Tax=Kitasatospora sp. NPDC057223 TaxID=3346055 RepID=UPI003627DC7C